MSFIRDILSTIFPMNVSADNPRQIALNQVMGKLLEITSETHPQIIFEAHVNSCSETNAYSELVGNRCKIKVCTGLWDTQWPSSFGQQVYFRVYDDPSVLGFVAFHEAAHCLDGHNPERGFFNVLHAILFRSEYVENRVEEEKRADHQSLLFLAQAGLLLTGAVDFLSRMKEKQEEEARRGKAYDPNVKLHPKAIERLEAVRQAIPATEQIQRSRRSFSL